LKKSTFLKEWEVQYQKKLIFLKTEKKNMNKKKVPKYNRIDRADTKNPKHGSCVCFSVNRKKKKYRNLLTKKYFS